MTLREERDRGLRSYPQGALETPFLEEEFFVGESEAEREARLAALEAESPFQSAFEQRWALTGAAETGSAEAFGDEFAFEEPGIIEGENRVRVRDTTGVPWRWICKIIIEDNGRRPVGHGTGGLVSDRHVLTAAHVVYEAYKNMHQYTITVIPALNDLKEPFDSYSIASKPKMRKEYSPTAADSLDWDYALLTLSTAIGKKSFQALKGSPLCYWGSPQCGANTVFARPDPRTLNGKTAYTAGYPGGKGGKQLWCAAGILHTAIERRRTMQITADTTKGQSGSPVWVIDNKRYCLVGVAVGTRRRAASNTVVRVTRELIRQVGAWISEDGDTPSMAEAKELFESAEIELGEANETLPDREEVELAAARRSPFQIPEEFEVFAEIDEDYAEEEASLPELLESPQVQYDEPQPISKGISDALSKKDWARALELAIQEGWRDKSKLTNLLFFERHPELGGRKLDPDKNKEDEKLSQEWVRILKREVRPAIQKASEDTNLKVSGEEVVERDPLFSGKTGKRFTDLVEGVAREVDINPGLLAAVLLAERDKRSLYLSSGDVWSFDTGTDDFYEQRAQLRTNVSAFSKVRFDEKRKTKKINEHGREVISIPFKSGTDAALATAVYLKYAEIKLRKGAQKNGGDFDKLPIETRLALVRIAMAAGHGGISPEGELLRFKRKNGKVVALKKGESGGFLVGVAERLDRVLKGEDILVRKNEPRKDPSRDKHITNRNATILVAQALHLSEWVFGIPVKPAIQPEIEAPQVFEEDVEGFLDLEAEPELEQSRVESVPGVDFADELEEFRDVEVGELEETHEETVEQAAEQIESLDEIEHEGTEFEEAEDQRTGAATYDDKLDEALLKLRNLPNENFGSPHGRNGKFDQHYWIVKDDPKPWGLTEEEVKSGKKRKMLVLKPGKKPSKSIEEIIKQISTKWTMDCAYFVQAAQLYAVSQVNPIKFDQKWENKEFWFRYHESSGIKMKYFFRRNKKGGWEARYGYERKWHLVSSKWNENTILAEMPRGSRIMWTNKQGKGDFRNENTVKVSEDRYSTFGFDTHRVLTGRQVALILAAIARNEEARDAGLPSPDDIRQIIQDPANASKGLRSYTDSNVFIKEAVRFHRP